SAERIDDPAEHEQRRRPRRLLAVLDGHVAADHAGRADRPDARDVSQPAVDHDRHVHGLGACGKGWDLREHDPELRQARVRIHGGELYRGAAVRRGSLLPIALPGSGHWHTIAGLWPPRDGGRPTAWWG